MQIIFFELMSLNLFVNQQRTALKFERKNPKNFDEKFLNTFVIR
jgi:hypothetical protein